MTESKFLKTAGVLAAFVAMVIAGMVTSSRRVIAHDDDDDERDEARVRRGFEIAPVPLDLVGKNRHLVGLGATSLTRRVTAMAATPRDQPPNLPWAETLTLAKNLRRSIRRRTWAAEDTSF